ncbi:myotubularin-related protein 14 isoform X13 [Pongo pygmaeus]|uniref:myotubularin-related protein 14 isoform X13 n=1 Tax=Pongo pygmaeus TaxID=9600 RepID=UPI0023E32F2E|nr:myotubularin-related protein 14 isoform X17 [Pongo pygmaeus]XP_054330174.1 myotubularin-related protein 14 isoform X17 [Pongo pygmaeus]
MAGARAAAAAASAGSSASSGNQQPQEPGLGELLEEFSRTQYRAKDGSGTGGSKVERIEKRCLELFGRDYCFSVIPNTNGDICGHYPRHIVFLEYESSEKEKDTGDTHLFDKVRGYDIKLLRYLSVKYICDLMVENKKVKFGMNVTSSEKVDKAQRYADFTLLSIPYPGCEFFKEYKDRDYMAEGLIFNWKQDYVDAPLSIPDFLTHSLNIDWSQYQCWDLVQQTQNYLKLLLSLVNSDDDSGLLVHCISGWDRTPLFISLLRLSLWADGLIHTSLKPAEILYLTVAYDWFLFGHMLVDRLSKGEEIFFFCFNFLKHITSEEFSALKTQRRKSLPARDGGFTLEDICMLRRKDRGSTTSLGSDFSLVMESSPGATGSFTYEAVELVPAGAPTQAAWLAALSDRETRLQEVRSAFLAAYSSTVGLRAVAPSPSGAIGGLLEQFARGVGLRGISSNAL